MRVRQASTCAAIAAVACAISSSPAHAWGLGGHKMIGQAAVARLPASLPAFVRTDAAKYEIVYLQNEEDRLKLGEYDERAWSAEWPTDHYVDIDDSGMIGGAVSINALPATREDFDMALMRATPPMDPYRVGFLPYAIIEGYEQVRTDFALWRMADASERPEREKLAIHDIGIFAHFVGDGSQPLHTSVHYNGWGRYPNPNGYTDSRSTHADFEDEFVDKFVPLSDVSTRVGDIDALSAIPLPEIERYLVATHTQVVPFYELQKTGAFALSDYNAGAHAKGVTFAAQQLARASQMLDSLILTAWQTSAGMKGDT